MITQRLQTSRWVATATAMLALAGIAASAQTLERGATKGGATLLTHSPHRASTEHKVVTCPSCKDEVTRRVDWSARGATKPTVLVPKHLCAGCTTTGSVVGHGKEKELVAQHKCTSSGAELACCASAGDRKVGARTKTAGKL